MKWTNHENHMIINCVCAWNSDAKLVLHVEILRILFSSFMFFVLFHVLLNFQLMFLLGNTRELLMFLLDKSRELYCYVVKKPSDTCPVLFWRSFSVLRYTKLHGMSSGNLQTGACDVTASIRRQEQTRFCYLCKQIFTSCECKRKYGTLLVLHMSFNVTRVKRWQD